VQVLVMTFAITTKRWQTEEQEPYWYNADR